MKTKLTKPRIGIYPGTFDPIHSGQLSFALQAIKEANLDEVIFLPERKPRFKPGAEHFGHRVAMLKAAIQPHPKLSVAELVDRQFTVRRSWPRLKAALPPDAELVLLLGSDTAALLPTWNHANELLAQTELLIGVRHPAKPNTIENIINGWPVQPKSLKVLPAHAPHISGTAIRAALRNGIPTAGLLASVSRYTNRQWLYVSLHKRTAQ